MNNIISLRNISYVINKKIIIDDISLDIYRNEIIALRGSNGAGKTTLLKLMYGLMKPTSGLITKNYKNDICTSFIFQNPNFLKATVYENLTHALYCKNIPKTDRKNKAVNLLKKYSLEYLSDKYIHHLSGGELQLVSLLRSLVIEPKIIFYDEPTNNLDSYNTNLIFTIIKDYINNNIQLILVSHDVSFLDNLKCTNIMLKDGRLVDV